MRAIHHHQALRTDDTTGRRWTTGRAALVAVGVIALTTACTGAGGKEAAKSPTASATQLGARAALSGFACEPDAAGAWSATGRLSNPDAAKATYVVRISVAGKDSHVVAGVTKNVTVDAASEAKVDAAAFGKATGKGLRCSAHVTRAVG